MFLLWKLKKYSQNIIEEEDKKTTAWRSIGWIA
jgi:hypothetical protein